MSKLNASQALLKFQPLIEERWVASITLRMKEACILTKPILFNYVPSLLKQLVCILDDSSDKSSATESSTAAQEHGGERFRLTSYEVSHVVLELQILKDVIYSTLNEKIKIKIEDQIKIERSIDSVIKDSVAGFVITESRFREQYTAMLAHDIRNPISFIAMAVQLLLQGVDDPAEVHDIYRRIMSNAQKADQLIQNILDVHVVKARGKFQLHPEEVDILEVIRSSTSNWQERVVVHAESIRGYWSPRELARALDNLLQNADKYGAKGQPIIVSAEKDHGWLLMKVHNEGDPIPFEEQENIFQPLQRARVASLGEATGWGFGLPIVRSVIEAHGGTMNLESELGKGTTFSMQLPLDSRPFIN